MASKKIKRTLIESYDYEVMRRNGKTMELIGVVNNPSSIRSMKEQKQVLKDNEYMESDVLVLTGTTQKSYEMSEDDFKKYATVVNNIVENGESDNDESEQDNE